MTKEDVGIIGIQTILPDSYMKIEKMAQKIGLSPLQLFQEIGVKKKPVLKKHQNIITLSINAVKTLLEKLAIPSSHIDLIIHASCGIIEKQLWSPAAKIQKELNALNAFSFDLQNGCNSGNLALQIAAKLINTEEQIKNVLIIVADALSHIVDYTHISHKCIFNFSDAATAILVQKNAGQNKILSYSSITDPSFADSMFRDIKKSHIWMNESKEEDEALSKAYETNYLKTINSALEKANLSSKDVQYIVMNQGDHKLIDKLAAKLAYPKERIFRSHANFGHLGGSDIFFGLNHLLSKEIIKKNDIIVLASSAIGFSWGACVIQN